MEKGILIGQGRTAEIFAWGENRILKLFRNGLPSSIVQEEYHISQKLWEMGLPVVEVCDYIEEGGRCGIIMQRFNGETMLRRLKPWNARTNGRRMAKLHMAIQQQLNCGLSPYKQKLKRNISHTELLTEDTKARLNAYLEHLPDGHYLCHGDFHPDNILMAGDRAVVIDWMTAAVGDPLADVARTSIILRSAAIPDEKSRLEKIMIAWVRRSFLASYLHTYLEISGARIEDVEKWELPVAAARLTEWLPPKEKETLLGFINTRAKQV